ncbi:MAG: ATP synthase F1 subunit delta [Clostridia bacterium]|nr:ATP synthase F1 subunit delta [Clostridia bacterium]
MASSTQYGKALFEITEELGTTERVLSDMDIARRLFSDSPEYLKLLDTPAVPKEERARLADEALGSLDTHLTNLIKILSEHHTAYIFPKVCEEYRKLYDNARGIERAVAVSAVPMTKEQISALTARLERMTGKTVKLKNDVDPSILGGLIVRIGAKQLDGSVRAGLDSFEASLKELVI